MKFIKKLKSKKQCLRRLNLELREKLRIKEARNIGKLEEMEEMSKIKKQDKGIHNTRIRGM